MAGHGKQTMMHLHSSVLLEALMMQDLPKRQFVGELADAIHAPAKVVPCWPLKASVDTVASWHSPLPVASIHAERSSMLMPRSACSLSQKKQLRTPTSIECTRRGAWWLPLLSAKRPSLSLLSSCFPAAAVDSHEQHSTCSC